MGDIADMHVEAMQAGLDPNEMDGADWAEFYGDDEPATAETLVAMIGSDCRMLLSWIDDAFQMQNPDAEPDCSPEVRAKALATLIPEFTEEKATTLAVLLVELNRAANDEEDRQCQAVVLELEDDAE